MSWSDARVRDRILRVRPAGSAVCVARDVGNGSVTGLACVILTWSELTTGFGVTSGKGGVRRRGVPSAHETAKRLRFRSLPRRRSDGPRRRGPRARPCRAGATESAVRPVRAARGQDGLPRSGPSRVRARRESGSPGERRPRRHQGVSDHRHDHPARRARAHHHLERRADGPAIARGARRAGRAEPPGRFRVGRVRRRTRRRRQCLRRRSRHEHPRRRGPRLRSWLPPHRPAAADPRPGGRSGPVLHRPRRHPDHARGLPARRIPDRELRRGRGRSTDPRRHRGPRAHARARGLPRDGQRRQPRRRATPRIARGPPPARRRHHHRPGELPAEHPGGLHLRAVPPGGRQRPARRPARFARLVAHQARWLPGHARDTARSEWTAESEHTVAGSAGLGRGPGSTRPEDSRCGTGCARRSAGIRCGTGCARGAVGRRAGVGNTCRSAGFRHGTSCAPGRFGYAAVSGDAPLGDSGLSGSTCRSAVASG